MGNYRTSSNFDIISDMYWPKNDSISAEHHMITESQVTRTCASSYTNAITPGQQQTFASYGCA